MEIQFTGNVAEHDFEEKIIEKLEDIVDSTIERLQHENEGTVIESTVITGATFNIALNIKGVEEPQVLTVEHHEGHPEVFKWVVDLDADETLNNEKSSLYDDWTVAAAEGKEHLFTEIKSVYDHADLTLDKQVDYGTMSEVTLDHVDGYKVVKIYQHGKLIQEYKLIPQETETAE